MELIKLIKGGEEEQKVEEEEKEEEINDKTSLKRLKEIAKEKGIKNYSKYNSSNRAELIKLIKGGVEEQTDEHKEEHKIEKEEQKEEEINDKTSLKRLKEIAKEKGIKNYSKYNSSNRMELIKLIKGSK